MDKCQKINYNAYFTGEIMSKLKAQKPSVGIYESDIGYPTNDWRMFTVPCQCMSSDDTIHFIVEISDGQVVVETMTTQKTDYWSSPFDTNKSLNYPSWLCGMIYHVKELVNGLYRRIHLTKTIWVDGYIKYQQSTIMTPQQSLNYATALQESVEKMMVEAKKLKKEAKKCQDQE